MLNDLPTDRDIVLFCEKVAWPIVDSDCWLWIARKDKDGYGEKQYRGRKERAHRLAFVWMHGSIPNGLQIDHLCREPSCVNPDHLEPVTLQENLRRGDGYGQRQTCINGHLFTEANTGPRSDHFGGRRCRSCARSAMQRYRQRITGVLDKKVGGDE